MIKIKLTMGLKQLAAMLCSALISSSLSAETAEHISQQQINILNLEDPIGAFNKVFEVGDELFEHPFQASEGVGANVGNGQRFSLVPRADLKGQQQWSQHQPKRVTGPNARSCDICHSQPFSDGAGRVVMNNIRDPQHSGDVAKFINRQPPHIFGIGALQLLAEEMTQELKIIARLAGLQAAEMGAVVTVPLIAKGITFGQLRVDSAGTFDYSQVQGVDDDLLVKPIEWKGITSYIRAFARDAGHNELGMQATEMAGHDVDGDGDGVVNELSVGDITAMVIYQAAQPRPTTRQELAALGLTAPLSSVEQQQIAQGEQAFTQAACDSCHTPQLLLQNAVFSEPSRVKEYRDQRFPAGQDPVANGLSIENAITFDLTADLPDNRVTITDGSTFNLGNFQRDLAGMTQVKLFGDLKRHDMGPKLAESIDEAGTGSANFITAELWGVGSTPPYLHDGRATSLEQAILFHGGESASSRALYVSLSAQNKVALQAFLNNLVLYKAE